VRTDSLEKIKVSSNPVTLRHRSHTTTSIYPGSNETKA